MQSLSRDPGEGDLKQISECAKSSSVPAHQLRFCLVVSPLIPTRLLRLNCRQEAVWGVRHHVACRSVHRSELNVNCDRACPSFFCNRSFLVFPASDSLCAVAISVFLGEDAGATVHITLFSLLRTRAGVHSPNLAHPQAL